MHSDWVFKPLQDTYNQNVAIRNRWLELAQANAGKAVLGRIYTANLHGPLKAEQMPGHNGLAFQNAIVAGIGFIAAEIEAERIAEKARRGAAFLHLLTPEWAVRPDFDEDL